MLDWLKNITKEHPVFWKNYLSKFDQNSDRYAVISLETSGLNSKKDTILSFGGVDVLNDSIIIQNVFEGIIIQSNNLQLNDISNEFIDEKNQLKLTESQAIEMFINYIGNATLVGHRIHFDIEMINELLEKYNCGRLKNEALDIEVMYKKLHEINDKNFSLNELNQVFKIAKTERISTLYDAFSIAILFLKLKSRLGL